MKARSRDCKYSYINYFTGSIQCHKRGGISCVTDSCKDYKKDSEEDVDETQESNERRIEKMRGN